jgi:hypothetical protein
MSDSKDLYQIASGDDTLPVGIFKRFPADWTPADVAQTTGTIEDQDVVPGRWMVEFTHPRIQGPGAIDVDHPRCMVSLGIGELHRVDPLSPEAVALDPTGTGEGGIEPLEEISYDADRIGVLAPHVSKVYLRDRKTPVLVVGEFGTVQHLLEPRQSHPLQEADEETHGGDFAEVQQWVVFQRVGRGNVCDANEIAINPAFVVSVESERG